MPTLYDMMSNTRLRLGDPRAQRPNDMQLLNQVTTQLRVVKRHKRNTGIQWDFNEAVIQTVPNLARYQITATDFGTPLAVITYAPSIPTWIPRLIPFYGPQNMPYDWGFPPNLASWGFLPVDGSNCTAQRCAFFWHDNQPFIEFQPTPQLTAEYQVKYLENSNNTYSDTLTSSPAWTEDCDLIETRAAIALLPIAEWYAPDSKDGRGANAEKRRDLAVSLSAQEGELTRQFEAAALNFSGPRIHNRWDPCVG